MIRRCQPHKIRDVRDKLPERLRAAAEKRMCAAYHAETVLEAEVALAVLATELEVKHPGAAASLRESMDETLTVLRLGVPPTPVRTLRSINPIKSMISICRDHAVNVKNRKNGRTALRWCAASTAEAAKQFRRVNGFLHLPKLRAFLERHVVPQETVSACYNENVAQPRGRPSSSANRGTSSALAPPEYFPYIFPFRHSLNYGQFPQRDFKCERLVRTRDSRPARMTRLQTAPQESTDWASSALILTFQNPTWVRVRKSAGTPLRDLTRAVEARRHPFAGQSVTAVLVLRLHETGSKTPI